MTIARNQAAHATTRRRDASQPKHAHDDRAASSAPADARSGTPVDDALLHAFERGRVDDERRGLEQRSGAIRQSLHQEAMDLQLQQEDERQRVERLKSEHDVARRKLCVVEAENAALAHQITESEESLEDTRRELAALGASASSPGRAPPLALSTSSSSPTGDAPKSAAGTASAADTSADDTAVLAQLHVAEQRVSAMRGEHAALVEASTEVSKRLREASTQRDALAAEVGQLRELDARLKELNRNAATSEAEKLQKAHGRLVEALQGLKAKTTAAANERKFLAGHLLDGAKARAQSLREARLRCAGGDAASAFLRDVLNENVTLRRKSRQAMVDFMDERELLQEYVLVLMARLAEATQRLHRDLYDVQVASALKDAAISVDAVGFYAAQGTS